MSADQQAADETYGREGGSWADSLRRPSRSTTMFIAATLTVNAANYGFHVVISRILGPSQYGALAALLGVILVLAVPAGMLQAAVVSRTATLRTAGTLDTGAEAVALIKALGPIALLLFALILAGLTPALVEFLNVTWKSAALLAPYTALAVIASIAGGMIQGSLRFTLSSILLLVGVTIRLAGAITLTELGFGVGGALAATVIGTTATTSISLRALGVGRRSLAAARANVRDLVPGMQRAFAALATFWAFAEIDLVLARHFLSHREAGFYSSAGLLARAPLFLAASIATLAFPRFVGARGLERRRLLRRSLVMAGASTATAILGLAVLRNPLVDVAFGHRYNAAKGLVPLLALAFGFVAIVGLTTYFHLAYRSRAWLITLAGVVAEAAAITLFHGSAREIGYCVLGCGAAVAIAHCATARSIVRWQPPDANVRPLVARDRTVELSLVLPCHNAGHALGALLTELEACLQGTTYEIVVVSDGSTDDTVALARAAADPNVRALHYTQRVGKGHALRTGLQETRGRYVAFLDADGDIPPAALLPFLELMRAEAPDIVVGSKRHPLSHVEYPRLRRVVSWVYHALTRLAFRVRVKDTQTGIKMLRADVLGRVLPVLLEKRFAFDLELLVAARALGYARIVEAPVTIAYKFESTIRPHTVWQILRDTGAVWYRHVILDQYRPAERT
jgi:O-antigen/teichoic acid export membrane protein